MLYEVRASGEALVNRLLSEPYAALAKFLNIGPIDKSQAI